MDNNSNKKSEFIQEYVYVEEYIPIENPKKKKERHEETRGYAEIDLNDDPTTIYF